LPETLDYSSRVDLTGPHPLELDEKGRPLNNSACLFLNPQGRHHLITCRPNHRDGVYKKSILDFYRQGHGFEVLEIGVESHILPDENQLEILSKMLAFGKGPRLWDSGLMRPLKPVFEQIFMENAGTYIPVKIRGSGREVEVCVRKDSEVEMRQVHESIKVIESMGVPPLKVKAVCAEPSQRKNFVDEFEGRGELWRLYPPTRSAGKQLKFIRDSLEETHSGLRLYSCAPSGGKFMIEKDFMKLFKDFREKNTSRDVLAGQFADIISLLNDVNREGQPSLEFFGLDYVKLKNPQEELFKAIDFMNAEKTSGRPLHDDRQVDEMLSGLASKFSLAINPKYRLKDLNEPVFRNGLYQAIRGFKAETSQEVRIGLSTEFLGEIEWQPGARVVSEGYPQTRTHPLAKPHVISLILDLEVRCHQEGVKLDHVNVGSVVESLSKLRKLSREEHREVYIIEWKAKGSDERHVEVARRVKWDELHYREGLEFDVEGTGQKAFFSRKTVKRLITDTEQHWWKPSKEETAYEPLTDFKGRLVVGTGRMLDGDTALRLAREYDDYRKARRFFEDLMGVERPKFRRITRFEETSAGFEKPITVSFDVRDYVFGMAVDKIPQDLYGRPEFVKQLCDFMGKEAAINFTMGRRNPYTKNVIYGDGDEVVEVSDNAPNPQIRRILLTDSSSILGDVDSAYTEFTPAYAGWLRKTLGQAGKEGASREILSEMEKSFYSGLTREYGRLKLVDAQNGALKGMNRIESTMGSYESLGSRRFGWETASALSSRALKRLRETGVKDITDSIRFLTHIDLTGGHPFELDAEGIQKYSHACMFLEPGKTPHLVTCRNNHGRGIAKMSIMELYSKGLGIDVPDMNVWASAIPKGEVLDELAEIMLTSPTNAKTFSIKELLYPSLKEFFNYYLDKYVPIEIKGSRKRLTLHIRTDPFHTPEQLKKTAEILSDAGIPPDRIKSEIDF